MKRHIPNIITSLNLVAGSCGIIFILDKNFELAIYMILLAAVLDFLDGTLARLLNAYSDIGKSLDSLADLVSFGVLPGMMVYSLAGSSGKLPEWSPYMALLIPLLAGIRLAVFENDRRQKFSFRGLPVPANALFIASFSHVLLFSEGSFLNVGIFNYLVIIVLISILQVIFIPMLSLKFSNYGIRENARKYILLLGGLILVVTLGWEGIIMTFALYLLLSVVFARQ